MSASRRATLPCHATNVTSSLKRTRRHHTETRMGRQKQKSATRRTGGVLETRSRRYCSPTSSRHDLFRSPPSKPESCHRRRRTRSQTVSALRRHAAPTNGRANHAPRRWSCFSDCCRRSLEPTRWRSNPKPGSKHIRCWRQIIHTGTLDTRKRAVWCAHVQSTVLCQVVTH